jgi:hypothetical protein
MQASCQSIFFFAYSHFSDFSFCDHAHYYHVSDDSDLDIMHKEELQALRTSFAEKALRIVREILPTKVLALNATLESKQMSMDLSEVHVPIKLSTDAHPTGDASESARKKRKLDEDSSVDHQVDLLSNKYTAKSKELLPSNQVSFCCLPDPLRDFSLHSTFCRLRNCMVVTIGGVWTHLFCSAVGGSSEPTAIPLTSDSFVDNC